jgi:hypothetical protein
VDLLASSGVAPSSTAPFATSGINGLHQSEYQKDRDDGDW